MRKHLVLTGWPSELVKTEVSSTRRGRTSVKTLAGGGWPNARATRRVIAVLPRRLLIVKTFSVPVVAPQRLAKMVEVEAERQLPFPAAECALAYLAQRSGSGWQVLLAAARRDDVAQYLSALAAMGFRQVRLIPSTIAIAFGITVSGVLASVLEACAGGERLVAVVAQDGVEVLKVAGGRVIASHFLDSDPRRLKTGLELLLAAEASAEGKVSAEDKVPAGDAALAGDNGFAANAASTEDTVYPTLTIIPGKPVETMDEAVYGQLRSTLAAFGATQPSHAEDVIPLGALKAALSPDAGLFDLAREGGLSAAFGQRRVSRIRRAVAGGLAATLIAAGYFAYQVKEEEAAFRRVMAARDSLRAQVAASRTAWAKQVRDADELREWATLIENKTPWLEVLNELGSATPPSVTITDARFEKGKTFSFVGVAQSEEALSAFLQNLGKTSWFGSASLGYARDRRPGATNEDKGSGGLVEFSVTGTLGARGGQAR